MVLLVDGDAAAAADVDDVDGDADDAADGDDDAGAAVCDDNAAAADINGIATALLWMLSLLPLLMLLLLLHHFPVRMLLPLLIPQNDDSSINQPSMCIAPTRMCIDHRSTTTTPHLPMATYQYDTHTVSPHLHKSGQAL